VPRVDSLRTLVKTMNGAVVARYMDTTTHVNDFSDESLCTALVEEGFSLVAVWYFGPDAYEALVQVGLRLNVQDTLDSLADLIPHLQANCDAGFQCDDAIMATVPSDALV